MKIVNEDYAYGTNENNFILYKLKSHCRGKEEEQASWAAIGFYSSIKTLLKSLGKKVAMEHLEELKAVEFALDELKWWIELNVEKVELCPKLT